MKIHEYQAKELLRRYGISVPEGEAVFEVERPEGNADLEPIEIVA